MFKQKTDLYIKKIIELINNKSFILPFLFLSFTAILCSFVFFVGSNAVDIPYMDQWGVANVITGKSDLFQILSYQHNEHRIGVGLLIMKVLAKYSNWSQILEIKFISVLIILSSLIFSYVKYSLHKKFELLDIVIPLIILNIFQTENLTWGFQIAFVLPLFFFCVWMLALKITDIKLRYLILTFLSLLSAFSSFHGLILPFITLILFSLDYFKYKLTSKKTFFLASVANIAIICSYFIGFAKNTQIPLSLAPSWEIIKYFSLAVSDGFFYHNNDNIFINVIIASIVLFFLFLGISKIFKNKQSNKNILIGCFLILYSMIFVSIISAGRSALGINQAFALRYVTFTMLIPLGLFFVFSSIKYGNYLKLLLLLFILSNSLFLSDNIIKHSTGTTISKRLAIGCYKTVSVSNLGECYKTFALYPDEEYLNQRIVRVLQYKRVNEFKKVDEIPFNISILPSGKPVPIDVSKIFTNFQNVTVNNSDFSSLNIDPNMQVIIDDIMKGISWESTATGNARAYFTFDEKSDFSEKYAFTIKPTNGIFIVNLEKIQEVMNKKIFKLRIDPTDKIEGFKINNLQVYK